VLQPVGERSRQAKVWFLCFCWSVVLCVAVLLANLFISELKPNHAWGMAYGIAAAVLLCLVAAWAVRRRIMGFASRFHFGTSRSWLYLHIYGGLLFLLLMLMHSGFRIPQGPLTLSLWILSIWTVASGILGLVFQKWIPRVLASGLSTEVLYDRIPSLIAELRTRAEDLARRSEEPVQNFYAKNLQESFQKPRRHFIYFWDITGGIKARLQRFEYLRGFLSADGFLALDELEDLYRTKLELDAHFTLQQPLRWWLLAHVPTSWVLLVFVVVHIFTVIYY